MAPDTVTERPPEAPTKAPRRSWREFLDLSWLTGRKGEPDGKSELWKKAADHGCTPEQCDAIERMAAGDHRPAPAPPRARPARLLEVREINFTPPPARPRPVDALPGLLADRPGNDAAMRQRYIRRADILLPAPPLPPPDPDAVIRAKRRARSVERRGAVSKPKAPRVSAPISRPEQPAVSKPRGRRKRKGDARGSGSLREVIAEKLRATPALLSKTNREIARLLSSTHPTVREAKKLLGDAFVRGTGGAPGWKVVRR